MQILQTKVPCGKTIHVFWANHFFQRLRGLIGRRLAAEEAMLITPCNQVHCYFMKIPIDVVYLSDMGTVLSVTQAMQPNTCGRIVKKAKSVLELPAFSAKAYGIVSGENLTFERWEKTK